jgi:uncharacterized protein (DUF924 family)
MTPLTVSPLVLSFWFGEPDSPEYGQPKNFWFQSNPLLDQQIRDQFEDIYQKALKGDLNGLMDTPEGSLALILIFDQFSRNMYRGTAQAFATDHKAREIAKAAIDQGFDKQLPHHHRAFLYLPFEHSESLEDQEKSVALFESLGNKENLDYALRHREIMVRFGRFPHRNIILGRESTPEEIDFLKEPNSSF